MSTACSVSKGSDRGAGRRGPKGGKAVVIGSGPAGLAAGYTLAQRGVDVTILEASDHAGGRMRGETVDGFHISTGAQFFDSSYRTAGRLASELGVATHSLRLAGAMGQHHPSGGFRRASFTNLALMRLCSPRAAWQVLKVMRRLARRRRDLTDPDYANALDLDVVGESFADYALRHGGPEMLSEVCDPFAVGFVLAGPERIGALFGLRSLFSALGNPSPTFNNPQHGVGAFATALAQVCADYTRLATPVQEVVVRDGAVHSVVTPRGSIEAAAVICATTATAALSILPGVPSSVRDTLGQVTYSRACHTVFGVENRPLPNGTYLLLFPTSAGSFLASIGDATVAAPLSAPAGAGLIHAYAPEAHSTELFAQSDDEIAQRFNAEIRRAVPQMPATAIFSRVYRFNEAVCLAPGGLLSAMHRLRCGAVPGADGLFLAGEYTDYPGVEGALRSGVLAANNVQRHLATQ